jgi:hypothetical protein
MDFTEIYRQSGSLVSFSPGAHFLLTAVGDRLVVRRSDTFHVSRSWQLPSLPSPSATAVALASSRPSSRTAPSDNITPTIISQIGWSPDSEYVFAACAKSGLVCAFRMRDEGWTARIETGAEGLLRAEWAPDGRHILCFSEWGVSHTNLLYFSVSPCLSWQLRVNIWSLVTGTATYIQYPLHPDRGMHARWLPFGSFTICKGHAFRQDGRYFVLAERHKSKDTIGVYDAADSFRLARVRLSRSVLQL